jgi:hypothetical protein
MPSKTNLRHTSSINALGVAALAPSRISHAIAGVIRKTDGSDSTIRVSRAKIDS